jgi:hypothetical protein
MDGMRQMTFIRKIHRAMVNGRPPASEFKTPMAAVTAARTLYADLERKLTAENLKPLPGELGVSIGYVSPDLSVIGLTPLFVPGSEAALMTILDGNIMLGLIFGMTDRDAKGESERIVLGIRPFHTTKQTEAWLSELLPIVRAEMLDPD